LFRRGNDCNVIGPDAGLVSFVCAAWVSCGWLDVAIALAR
jgi:hypothetical protein